MESIMVHFRFPQASSMLQGRKKEEEEEEEDDDDKSLTATFFLSPSLYRLLQKGEG
jgi:hypothetical protein